MPIFTRHGRRGQIDKELQWRIRTELEAKYSRPVNGKEFLSRSRALEVLTWERVRDLFKKLSWYKEEVRDEIYPGMCSIICILITINFEDWDNFQSIFFAPFPNQSRPKYMDRDLPLKPTSTLPENLRESFLRQQYTFLPVVIEQDTHTEWDENYPLPILKVEAIAGEGAQGDVDKVYIEKGFLHFSSSATRNFEAKAMARKRITRKTTKGQKSFATEQKNLKQFKQSLQSHRNIMQSFASFTHGSDFVILSEWAEGRDLSQFLYQPHQVFSDYEHRSRRWSPYHLFIQAFCLAEALDFLHYHMVNSQGARYVCAHLDLKPENVLVYLPTSGNSSEAPVGQWKITDFGLSNVELSVAQGELVSIPPPAGHVANLAPGALLPELSLLKRGPGPFQPPEVRDADTAKVSTRRDVWSFGCILAMVLAFALGGPEEVEYQRQCRSKGADDYFYVRHSYAWASAPSRISGAGWVGAEVKPKIKSWLLDRAPGIIPEQSQWVHHCANLVLRLLDVDIVQRPEMKQAATDLHTLTMDYLSIQPHDRLWEFHAPTIASTSVKIIPDKPDRQDTAETRSVDSRGPYVGVRSNSSASSVNKSTLLGLLTSKSDPSSHYIRLQTIDHCQSATICPTGSTVVFWNKTQALLYDLNNFDDENSIWQETCPRSVTLYAQQMAPSVYSTALAWGYSYKRIVLNCSFMAVLEYVQPSNLVVRIHSRASVTQGDPIYYEERVSKVLDPLSDGLKLSPQGACLIRSTNKIQFINLQGSIGISVQGAEVMGYDFTGDGMAFCIWARESNNHCWSVFDASRLGEPVVQRHVISGNHTLAPEAFLSPFHGYARFVACDKRGSIFLVCADANGPRVQCLGYTENVFASLMLPNDDSFILIRASQHSNQKVQKINLTSMADKTSFRPYDFGHLPNDIETKKSGICVRAETGRERGICILTVSPDGILARKVLPRQ